MKNQSHLQTLVLAMQAVVLTWVVTQASAQEVQVADVKTQHRNGQTFVTWRDVAENEVGAEYRYNVYRSTQPITQGSLAQAELVGRGIPNNSAVRFGYAFSETARLDPKTPMVILREGSDPLPRWRGLAVHTAKRPEQAYYAVVATDLEGNPATKVTAGVSATERPVDEQPAPLAPIKLGDSNERGRYARLTSITGKRGLPLTVHLHASQGRGGPPHDHGDLWYYFSTEAMGYRDGLPGYFTVHERRYETGNRLYLNSRDAVEHPSGMGVLAVETYWFGYYCVPQWAEHEEPRAYNFTERRMLWLIQWVAEKYGVNRDRISAAGGSMGAWGTATFAFRHPEIFASVYPNRPRTRQRGLPALLARRKKGDPEPLMADGKTPYFERMDMVRFASEHHQDLPFIGWCCGRHDGFASWREQIDMVRALTEAHHGFAFAWNNGNHSSGSRPMEQVTKYYPADLFRRNQSYPAFGNSSIDDDPGNGDPANGDLEGGINLGFRWKDVVDEPASWTVTLANGLCKNVMTADVTPRRCQRFKPPAGAKLRWTNSADGAGAVTVDKWGLVTVPSVVIKPGEETRLEIKR